MNFCENKGNFNKIKLKLNLKKNSCKIDEN